MLHSISHEEQPLSHAIISNAKALVEAQQYLFETLWNKAIPAEEKIMEIEEGVRPPFIETLKDPYEIQKLSFDLVDSAKEEILMLFFPPNNAFLRDQYAGVIELLKEAVTVRAIRVRILMSKDEQEQIDKLIQEIMIQKGRQQERQSRVGKFEIHSFDTRQHQQSLPTNVSILISDSKVSLVEEYFNY
jgi:two-component system sensor histidine kinase VicK